jgi:hypothetical protein
MSGSDLLSMIKLIWPLFVAGLVAGLIATTEWKGPFNIQLGLGFIFIERTLEGGVITKVVLGIIGAGFFAYHGFRDFSGFFPVHYRMRVHFDTQGVEAVLKGFTRSEQEDLNLKEEWHKEKQQILDRWNSDLGGYGVQQFRVTEQTAGRGDTTFRARKIKGNLQSYLIEESYGLIEFNLSGDTSASQAWSQFELLDTEASVVRGSYVDAYVRGTKILRPRFAQWIQTAADARYHADDVTAVTKIRFFPFIRIGRTLYLVSMTAYQTDSNGHSRTVGYNVPIGYAILDPD